MNKRHDQFARHFWNWSSNSFIHSKSKPIWTLAMMVALNKTAISDFLTYLSTQWYSKWSSIVSASVIITAGTIASVKNLCFYFAILKTFLISKSDFCFNSPNSCSSLLINTLNTHTIKIFAALSIAKVKMTLFTLAFLSRFYC